MSLSAIPDAQDELLRILDTRIACLLVDRPGTEALRRNLMILRDRLARDPLDAQTIAQVEAVVRELRPRRPAPESEPTSPHAGGSTAGASPGSELLARTLSATTGLAGLAILALQISG